MRRLRTTGMGRDQSRKSEGTPQEVEKEGNGQKQIQPLFWLNIFDCIHKNMTNHSDRAIINPVTNPQWFTQAITYLLPKSKETNIPKNCRAITCLSTTYKILTLTITERTYSFLDANTILPSEEKGCKKAFYA